MAARALLFRTTHNQRLIMPRDQHNVDFHGLFDYFERSRINTILTNHPALYRGYLEDFWRDIRVIIPDAIPGENGQLPVFPPPFIRFSINNQQFQFTAADLRLILNLGTVAEEDGPTEFPNDLLWGCFHRMGFTLPIQRFAVPKSGFYGKWRYFAHVLVTSLSNRHSGHDQINRKVASQMVALTLNRPYSFSNYFFEILRDHIADIGTGRAQFLMLPRIVMTIINHFLPDLPPQQEIYEVGTPLQRIYAMMRKTKQDPDLPPPPDPPLFGHLINPNYVAPAEGWEDPVEGAAPGGGNDDNAPPPPPSPQQPPHQQPPHQQPPPEQQPPLQQPEIEAGTVPEDQGRIDDAAFNEILAQTEHVPENVARGVINAALNVPEDDVDQVEDFPGLDNLDNQDVYIPAGGEVSNQHLGIFFS